MSSEEEEKAAIKPSQFLKEGRMTMLLDMEFSVFSQQTSLNTYGMKRTWCKLLYTKHCGGI